MGAQGDLHGGIERIRGAVVVVPCAMVKCHGQVTWDSYGIHMGFICINNYGLLWIHMDILDILGMLGKMGTHWLFNIAMV